MVNVIHYQVISFRYLEPINQASSRSENTEKHYIYHKDQSYWETLSPEHQSTNHHKTLVGEYLQQMSSRRIVLLNIGLHELLTHLRLS